MPQLASTGPQDPKRFLELELSGPLRDCVLDLRLLAASVEGLQQPEWDRCFASAFR
jgi:hypothetical protein